VSDQEPPSTPADLARTLREAADRLMSGWTAALTGPPARDAVKAEAGSAPDADAAAGSPGDAGARPGSGPRWPAGVPGMPDLSAVLGPLVPPATLSARQLQTVLDDLAARRAQVQALRTQLGLFDEQLAALETSLGPVLEWTQAWAGMEQTMTNLWQPPRA
jgi:hypothetical protein